MKSIDLNCPISFILLFSFIIILSQNNENFINMTIIGTGKIKIFYSIETPSEVLFNGNNIGFIEDSYCYYVRSSENKENNVIIKYNKEIKIWSFEDCISIISIDLSNFDSSYKTNMDFMFLNFYFFGIFRFKEL